MMRRQRLTEEARLRIQKALHVRPHTYAELQAITGLKYSVVANHIGNLREQKIVHIGAWGRESEFGPHHMMFAWGNKPDVARPPAPTAAQRMAKTRANRRQP